MCFKAHFLLRFFTQSTTTLLQWITFYMINQRLYSAGVIAYMYVKVMYIRMKASPSWNILKTKHAQQKQQTLCCQPLLICLPTFQLQVPVFLASLFLFSSPFAFLHWMEQSERQSGNQASTRWHHSPSFSLSVCGSFIIIIPVFQSCCCCCLFPIVLYIETRHRHHDLSVIVVVVAFVPSYVLVFLNSLRWQ